MLVQLLLVAVIVAIAELVVIIATVKQLVVIVELIKLVLIEQIPPTSHPQSCSLVLVLPILFKRIEVTLEIMTTMKSPSLME